ncbi:MAG: hypothetical protein QW713_00630 [Sulfolobales archaeon]
MALEFIRRNINIWLRNNMIIFSVFLSLILVALILVARYRDPLIPYVVSILLSIEISVSVRVPLERFYKALAYIGGSRKHYNLSIAISTLISMIPLYTMIVAGIISPWLLIPSFILLYYINRITVKRSLSSF